MLENFGYRLLPLWREEIISEALEDMDRAARQTSPETGFDMDWDTATCFGSFGDGTRNDGGRATAGFGEQLTPAETPVIESVRGIRDLTLETQKAFQSGLQYRAGNNSCISERLVIMEEAFPLYVEPMMEGLSLGRR